MSYLSTFNQVCPNLQSHLNDAWVNATNGVGIEQIPFLEFLFSEANRGNIAQTIYAGGGKTRKLEVVYDQRILESQVSDDVSNPNCSATTKRGDCITTYEIDSTDNVGVEELVEIQDLEKNCESNGAFFVRKIRTLIDAVERKVATRTATEAALLTGKYSTDVTNIDASDNLQVATLKSVASGDLSPLAQQIINRAARKTGYTAPYVIFGGDDLVDYYERSLSGCCANEGIDIGDIVRRFGVAVGYDQRAADALGGQEFNLMFQIGALQLLYYTRAPWKDGVMQTIGGDAANYTMTGIVSPRTGIPMDLSVKDDCGDISINLVATTKLIGMPADMFPTGDKYDGVNFVNTIEVVNA